MITCDRNGSILSVGDYARGSSGSIYRVLDLKTGHSDSVRAEIILAKQGSHTEPSLDNLTKISPEDAAFLLLGGAYEKV